MDNVSKTTSVKGMFKIGIIMALCITLIITLIVVYTNNRWKYELDVVYEGYDEGVYEYTITNKTNRTLKDVTIKFKVDNTALSDFVFDDRVGTLHAGETQTIKLYANQIKRKAEERDITLIFYEVDIFRITYE